MNKPCILRIEASAGAGKTYRLTSRYLELLANLEPHPQTLRSVVAITFTNKAAAEMKERIVKNLKNIALATEEGKKLAAQTGLTPQAAAKWLEIIFEHFNDLQVRTIDSLVFSILKGIALEVGLRPDLEAELKEDVLLARAYDRLLLYLREGDTALRDIFRQVLLTFLEIEARSGFNPEKAIRKMLLDLFRYELKGRPLQNNQRNWMLKDMAEDVANAASRFLVAAEEAGLKFRYSFWHEKFLAPLDNFRATPFWKSSAADIFKGRGQVPPEVEALYADFQEKLEKYLFAWAVVRLIPYAQLYEKLKLELERLRQEYGLIHGGGWIEIVERVLREEGIPLVYCKLGTRFRHFLIDEFQDTSRAQWEALRPLVEEALARGGSLTYVGDVKQAIYVWRGGDPGLFKEVPQELPAELVDDPLPYNWRARENLVAFNNRFFGLLAEEGRARYVARRFLYAEREEERAKNCPHVGELAGFITETFQRVQQELPEERPGGQIEIVFCPGEDLHTQYEEILARLEKLLIQQKEQVTHKKIAILVRTNDQAEEIAHLLFEIGIPAVTENALRITSSQVVKALVSFLSFLDYPFNDVALAGFLRSKIAKGFLNLPEKFWKGAGRGNTLLDLLKNYDAEGFNNHLAPFLEKAGFLSPYDLVREVFAHFRIYERFPEEEAFLHRFLSLVLAFEQEGAGLSGFLERWSERAAEERLGLPEELSAVRVLTIHAAKGLEFDVVYLPFLHWTLKTPSLVTLEEGTLGYVQSPYPGPIKDKVMREKAAQALENLNLLYVAFTRAKEELYIFIPEKRPERASFGTGDIVRQFLAELGYRNYAS